MRTEFLAGLARRQLRPSSRRFSDASALASFTKWSWMFYAAANRHGRPVAARVLVRDVRDGVELIGAEASPKGILTRIIVRPDCWALLRRRPGGGVKVRNWSDVSVAAAQNASSFSTNSAMSRLIGELREEHLPGHGRLELSRGLTALDQAESPLTG